ncbi:SDR family NAD(P)-dependent oxidoreductase [Polymorphospora sp. NPDC051019]|uniref:SDR family NAD(P)-dependent oxidoreductase n=1 Tax=Polymorphospora sp. NPDC051019 TaxID=3155725 RepID=UPI00343CD4CA
MARLWFVTGAGRGLGRAFVEAALAHGDTVVATVRRDDALDDVAARFPALHRRRLDVADHATVRSVVDEVAASIGIPDIVVNNAGYGLVGAVEELGEAEIRAQFDVNLFGALWVTQAVLPHLRRRGSGRIVQVSTVGAVGHLPLFGAYNATKWALEGLSAALADEVRPHGIGVHLLQLGGFATDWAGASMRFATADPAYAQTRAAILGQPDYPTPEQVAAAVEQPVEDAGEWAEAPPSVAAEALLTLLDQPDPPLRTVIGNGAHDMVRIALEGRRDDYLKDPAFTWPGPPATPARH